MRYVAELLIGLGCVACGGHTVTEPQRGAQPDQAGATAGAGSMGGTPSQGGATTQPEPEPEPSQSSMCEGQQPMCVPDCASRDRMVADCLGAQYRCGMGWVALDSCPADACARAAKSCCSATGQSTFPECAVDGSTGQCPAGYRSTDVCVPEGLGVASCSELEDGTACSSPELVCMTDRCGRNCFCNPDASGELRWQCLVNLC